MEGGYGGGKTQKQLGQRLVNDDDENFNIINLGKYIMTPYILFGFGAPTQLLLPQLVGPLPKYT